MPGSLWRGYLQAQRAEEEEQEGLRQQKKERLEEQLEKLNIESLTQQMEMRAREEDVEEKARARYEESLENLRERGIDIDALITGYEPRKAAYPWMGTPYEEAGARKEFHIAPTTQTQKGIPGLKALPGYGINPLTGEIEETPAEMPSIETLYERADEIQFDNPELAEFFRNTADSLMQEQLGVKPPGRDFFGAGSYEELVSQTEHLEEAEREKIRAQAKEFFGIE